MKKFTTLEEDLLKENAQLAEKFDTYHQSILDKLNKIRAAVDFMKEEQMKDPRNWAYIGSITHIDENLQDILDFISVPEPYIQ